MTTGIEWTDETWNPVTGCTKVSQGCKHCYAERLWPKVEGARVKREGGAARPFTHVSTHPDRLEAPLRWRTSRRVFVNSMSDLFHEDVPDDFIIQVFDIMRQCANGWSGRVGGERGKLVAGHTFQILTKRPERMRDFCTRLRFAQNDERGLYLAKALPHNGFNPVAAMTNVWLGVSVEDQATADERIPLLLQTPAAIRFVSYEPALGAVDFTNITQRMDGATITFDALYEKDPLNKGIYHPRLDWIIAGGESGPNSRPSHPDWYRSVRDQCAAAGVAFFFKQWGNWIHEAQMLPDGGNVVDRYLIDEDGHAGAIHDWDIKQGEPASYSIRIPKKAAGRHLDGRTHDEYPT